MLVIVNDTLSKKITKTYFDANSGCFLRSRLVASIHAVVATLYMYTGSKRLKLRFELTQNSVKLG
jgi:hypothetical protein